MHITMYGIPYNVYNVENILMIINVTGLWLQLCGLNVRVKLREV